MNGSSFSIKPYFKSSCWNPAFREKTNEWVDFGNIGARGQFMRDRYELLLDPACKKPVVKFTYTQAGEDD